MQELSRGADHGSDLYLHVSLYAGNCLEHVRTLLIGYRSGGMPGFPYILRARDGIAGRRRGSGVCQRPNNLSALRVACRCSPMGFDRQQRLMCWMVLFYNEVLEMCLSWIWSILMLLNMCVVRL